MSVWLVCPGESSPVVEGYWIKKELYCKTDSNITIYKLLRGLIKVQISNLNFIQYIILLSKFH